MKNFLEKFFSAPWKAPKVERAPEVFKTSPFDLPIGDHFRDPDKKPKLATSIQKPSYELPDNSDYAKWTQDRINEKMKLLKESTYEKPDQNSRTTVLSFHSANGVRMFNGSPDSSRPDRGSGYNVAVES